MVLSWLACCWATPSALVRAAGGSKIKSPRDHFHSARFPINELFWGIRPAATSAAPRGRNQSGFCQTPRPEETMRPPPTSTSTAYRPPEHSSNKLKKSQHDKTSTNQSRALQLLLCVFKSPNDEKTSIWRVCISAFVCVCVCVCVGEDGVELLFWSSN